MKIGSFVMLAGTAIFLGCSHSPKMPARNSSEMPARNRIGEKCNVQLRRDALGAAAPNGISPNTGSMNGSDVAVAGTLKSANQDWIVLTHRGGEKIIPTHAILSIDFEQPSVDRKQ